MSYVHISSLNKLAEWSSHLLTHRRRYFASYIRRVECGDIENVAQLEEEATVRSEDTATVTQVSDIETSAVETRGATKTISDNVYTV